ncbi:hypothetical protein DSO57_1005219 [Entomophthora muscae]|uniref:Uncharacterized protein n=1 Tax=Entomophthora muscae TaxID=34485 RepID=A0ACC2T829_9FUNG|nr:hypothetical protein DSO57_1005219 [Entomophthora muscae]
MDNNNAPTPTLFHPLALAFLLSYLEDYIFLGRFNPLLRRYCLLGEIFHMETVSIPIGMLVTGLNLSEVINLLGDMFPSGWVPENCILAFLGGGLDVPSLGPLGPMILDLGLLALCLWFCCGPYWCLARLSQERHAGYCKTSVVWKAGCQKNKAELCLLCPFTESHLGTRSRKVCQVGCQKSKAVLRSASLFYCSLLA